jgi:hypothetical protein
MTRSKNTHPTTSPITASPEDPFLTTKQLAARQRRGEKTIRNDRGRGGYIPFHDLGRPRYRLSVIMAWEQERRVACAGCPVYSGDLRTERFLTPAEVESRHQRAVKTLANDRLYKRGISYFKFVRQIRYALSDVLAYEEAQRMTSTSEKGCRRDGGGNRPTIQ